MQVSPVQYTHAKVQAIIDGGRRLAGSGNEAVTDNGKVETFEQDGKICTGYEKNECARYCENYGKDEKGDTLCLKWGEICQGNICLKKKTINETVTVTEQEYVKKTNPSIVKGEYDAKQLQNAYRVELGEYEGLLLQSTTQQQAIRKKLTEKWNIMEKQWLAEQAKKLEDDMLALSQS